MERIAKVAFVVTFSFLTASFVAAQLYWFSLKWKIARFELATKDDIP